MLKFAWRWTKVGDKVLIHDRNNLQLPLIPAVIEYVKRVDRQNSIGVRTAEGDKSRFLWPTPLFVHPDPKDPEETCWICAENDGRSAAS